MMRPWGAQQGQKGSKAHSPGKEAEFHRRSCCLSLPSLSRPPAFPPQLEEWTCPMSDAQRSILEAICAVIDALLRDLARTNRVDM
jgi:hypothetical protein